MISPMLYGIILVCAALLALLLPETNNKSLPVNIDDMTASYPMDEYVTFYWHRRRVAVKNFLEFMLISELRKAKKWIRLKAEKVAGTYMIEHFYYPV